MEVHSSITFCYAIGAGTEVEVGKAEGRGSPDDSLHVELFVVTHR